MNSVSQYVKVSQSGIVVTDSLPMEVALTHGTSVKRLMADYPAETLAYLTAQIMRTCQYLECKHTITKTDDAQELALEIMEMHPTLKIEEYPTIFKNIRMQKYGKYYERLKAGEFLEAFKTYDVSEERGRIFTERATIHNKVMAEPLPEVDYSKWNYQPQKKKLSDHFSPEEKLIRQRAMADHILQNSENSDKSAHD